MLMLCLPVLALTACGTSPTPSALYTTPRPGTYAGGTYDGYHAPGRTTPPYHAWGRRSTGNYPAVLPQAVPELGSPYSAPDAEHSHMLEDSDDD